MLAPHEGQVRMRGQNCIEVWGNHTEEHFIITIDDQQQSDVDIIFVPMSGRE